MTYLLDSIKSHIHVLALSIPNFTIPVEFLIHHRLMQPVILESSPNTHKVDVHPNDKISNRIVAYTVVQF